MDGRSRFIPYAKQSISDRELVRVAEALRGDWITRGPQVKEFEQSIAAYCGAQFAVAFSSATAALAAAYFAADLSQETYFFTTPNTFIATILHPYQQGIQPRFIDIDRETGNLNLDQLEERVALLPASVPLCIAPVHFSGIAVDMACLHRFLQGRTAWVVEDAAHAFGSCYPTGERVGSCAYGDMTIFSFHPAKTITTGEGGIVTVNNPHLYHRLRLFRDNGIERAAPYLEGEPAAGYYEVHALTGNFHMNCLQAALGLAQLERAEEFVQKRRLLVQQYREELEGVEGIRAFTSKWDHSTGYHLFVVQIDFPFYRKNRQTVMDALYRENIGTQVHYIPLYRHPVLKEVRLQEMTHCPEMEAYYAEALSLPLYFDLQEKDVHHIMARLKKILD